MEQPLTYRPFFKNDEFTTISVWAGISILLFGLSVFQDYVFSRFQDTGFYISESLLYNTIWFLFVPLLLLEIKILERFQTRNGLKKWIAILGISSVLTLLHIFLFTSIFVAVSTLVFTPAHRFWRIFQSALSSQLYLIFICYVIAPFIHNRLINKRKGEEVRSPFSNSILVKLGLKTITLDTTSILLISTDKPYSVINTSDKKYIDNRTLKEFESFLNPKHFARVHRSHIININTVKELKSRQNGDYDALLLNGDTIRLSRHYRAHWQHLLH